MIRCLRRQDTQILCWPLEDGDFYDAWNIVYSKIKTYSCIGKDFSLILLTSRFLAGCLLTCIICSSAVTILYSRAAKNAGTFFELADIGRGDSL